VELIYGAVNTYGHFGQGTAVVHNSVKAQPSRIVGCSHIRVESYRLRMGTNKWYVCVRNPLSRGLKENIYKIFSSLQDNFAVSRKHFFTM
jgi:hypothetical protein